MADEQSTSPKDDPVRHLRKASKEQIETELDKRVEAMLVANHKSGGSWGDSNVIQMLNNELTGRYIKRTTTLALWIAGLSLAVSLVALAVSLKLGN